jgi:hypothetical protein
VAICTALQVQVYRYLGRWEGGSAAALPSGERGASAPSTRRASTRQDKTSTIMMSELSTPRCPVFFGVFFWGGGGRLSAGCRCSLLCTPAAPPPPGLCPGTPMKASRCRSPVSPHDLPSSRLQCARAARCRSDSVCAPRSGYAHKSHTMLLQCACGRKRNICCACG